MQTPSVTCQESNNGYNGGMDRDAAEHLPQFKAVGGRLCLDFVNTVGGRIDKAEGGYTIRSERLRTLDDLAAWQARFSPAAPPSPQHRALSDTAQRKALSRAIALREALYRIFRAVAGHSPLPAPDLDLLSSELAAARTGQRLVETEDGLALVGDSTASFPAPILGEVTESAVELLLAGPLQRIHQCAGESCGWMFLDESRNGRRRWCDMKDCGNLAKVRRFRERAR